MLGIVVTLKQRGVVQTGVMYDHFEAVLRNLLVDSRGRGRVQEGSIWSTPTNGILDLARLAEIEAVKRRFLL